MNIKKLLLGIGAVSAVSVPIATVVACGTKDVNATGDADGVFWDKVGYFDAKIVKWIDGDTPIVDVIDGTLKPSKLKDVHIRIAGIDTPELHVKNDATGKIDQLTTGDEFKYADAARIFADGLMPVGTTVRIATNGSLSYDRVVGHIFYGNDYKKNFEVDILTAGLAMPFITDMAEAIDKNTWQHYAYRKMADGFNAAMQSKKGMFEGDYEEVIKVHGSTSIENVRNYGMDFTNKQHGSIYYYTREIK